MRRFALTLAFAALAAFPSAAQEKPKAGASKAETPKTDAKAAALPTVDNILEKYVKALGGKEAIEKTSSRSANGSFEIEALNMSGTFEMFAKAPNKNAMKIDLPGVGMVYNVFDGVKGWDSNPMTGLRELAGEELATMKREADFYQPLNLKKHFPKLEVKGKDKVEEYETYVVVATPAGGGPEKLYFDIASGLLIRQDAERETGQGKIAVEEHFDDYKDVGGVMIPHSLRQITPMFAITMKFTEIKSNVEIDEGKFNKPSGN